MAKIASSKSYGRKPTAIMVDALPGSVGTIDSGGHRVAQGRSLYRIGPAVHMDGRWLFCRWGMTIARSPRSAKAAVTRWKKRMNLARVIGGERIGLA
jgi:hypothetical protein